MFEKFDIDDKNIFKVCVVATMSSGKSTFINSIIGEEVMPEKNEACTARTMAVLDNDAATIKKAHIIRKDGAKEVVEIDNREVLDRVNNDEDIVDFLVETDIQSISNTSRALMLVDTPGVNNSKDVRHGERTEEFLKQMDMGVIVYLLNATQLATNDDSVLLQLVSDHIKRQKGNVKIIFVINKIDALDLETESIAGTVKIAKEYIEQHDILNPVIYPLSALAAKTLRMALYRKEMTRRELRKLEDIYEHYQSKDNNMLAFAMTDELSEEKYEIGDWEVSAQELQRAIDNTGITAIEKRLEGLMREIEQHYAPEVVIKSQMSESSVQKFQKRLDEVSRYPQDFQDERFKLSNDLINDNILIQSMNQSLSDIKSISATLEMLDSIEKVSADINLLVSNIQEVKRNLFECFKTDAYIAVKRIKGWYFYPEKNEHTRISIKNLYLMSADGIHWNSVQFGHATRLLEAGKSFYLYNEYSTFVFRVNTENGSDVIALLDTKIPVGTVKISGMAERIVSISEVKQYIQNIEEAEEIRRKEIAAAEEQLRRTYKGIVFDSEEMKDSIIKKEQQIQEYCFRLENHSYEELWQMKEKVEKLPSAIFSVYISKIIAAMGIQENREKNCYLDRIELTELCGLNDIEMDLEKEHYSDVTKNVIKDCISKRQLQCQRIIFDAMLNQMDTFTRSELKQLILQIKEKEFNADLTCEYIGKINRQFDWLEMQELKSLCANVEHLSIDELLQLEKNIKQEGYQNKYADEYYQMISSRIEFLHVKNMEQYCVPIFTVDRDELKVIEKKINDENCMPELKTRFLNLVFQRSEQLDYEDLCLLTENIHDKKLDELELLYKDLQSGKYNKKFIKEFIVKSRVYLELSQQAAIDELIANLANMNKEMVIDVQHEIKKKNYADRVIKNAQQRMAERIYELDMYELMEMENNFDSLDLKDIQSLRSMIRQKSVCERAKSTYEKKLHMRELVVAYQLVSPLSCFVKQTMEQYNLSGINLVLATFSADYEKHLVDHFERLGNADYNDIPVLFYPECSKLTISKTRLYCNTSSGYASAHFSEIRSFSIERKLFQELLIITFTNGNAISLSGGLNKKMSQAFANLLTAIHQNANNEMILSRYQPYFNHVAGLSKEEFETYQVSEQTNIQTIVNIFKEKMLRIETIKKNSSIKHVGIDNWDVFSNKVKLGMGIDNDQVVFFYDKTILKSAKDGFAIGEKFVHLKIGQQPLISIPMSEIYEVTEANNKLMIFTINNNTFNVDFVAGDETTKHQIVELIDEYVKGIQLVNHLPISVKTKEVNVDSNIQPVKYECPNCNATVKIGANFCSQCGKKLPVFAEEASTEFFFCTECGNKIRKGKKFCSQCGCKVEV